MVWTIGHSTRSLEALVGLLRAHGIRHLVDIRSVPRSRRNPQFNADALPGPLAGAGIRYTHLPPLGGLRRPRPDSPNTGWGNAGFRGYADHMQTAEFAAALEALRALAAAAPTAVMCAEAVPWRCHRWLLADALVARGEPVAHIVSDAPPRAHALTPSARVEGTRLTYPGPLQLFPSDEDAPARRGLSPGGTARRPRRPARAARRARRR